MLFLGLLATTSVQAQNSFKTTGSTGVAQHIIEDNSSGNVGIGITAPISNLSIEGFGSPKAVVEVLGTNMTTSTASTNTIKDNSLLVHNSGNIALGGKNGQTENDPFEHTLFVVKGKTENTGVGIYDPTTRLHVYGEYTGTTDLFQVSTDKGPAMYVTSSGLTGIGTASPNFLLDVSGNANVSNTLHVGSGTNAGALHIYGANNGAYGYANVTEVSNSSTKALAVINSNTDKFVVYGDGRTVVGDVLSNASTQANASLTVNNISGGEGIDLVNRNGYSGWSNQIRFINSTNNIRHLIFDDASATGGSKNNLVIIPGYGGGAANVLEIKGKVKIGNVPLSGSASLVSDYSLYVQKGIIAEKYRCAISTGTQWADYVFEDDYTLSKLSDLEKYIKVNKHLPNIPTTKDVLKDGVDMADIEAKLLRKIEELTLYLIEQDKKIESLNSCLMGQ